MGVQSLTSRWLVTSPAVVRVGTWLRKRGLDRVVDRARGTLLHRAGPFCLDLDGVHLEGTRPHDAHYFSWVSEGRERYLLDVLRAHLEPGMTVVDVGAYVGLITLTAARAVGPSGRVIAFEPHPESVEILRGNVRRAGATHVTVHDVALSDDTGTGVLHVDPECERTSLVPGRLDESEPTMTRIACGDALLRGPVELVKIDAEGAELAVLRGMAKTLAASPRAVLIVEFAPDVLRAAGHEPADLVAVIGELGFEVAVIDEAGERLLSWDEGGADLVAGGDRFGDEAYANLLCTRPGRERREPARAGTAHL
jgi:FkbM family methyltransferase